MKDHNPSLEAILNFIVEVEKLKGVLRKTRPVGLERYENSAEHSWHVCLSALVLRDYANEPIDIDKVIRMLLIHDLGEIDAGDQIVYAAVSAQRHEQERAGIQRVLDNLPEDMAGEFLSLWDEFEAGESPESLYARAIDRLPPLLHNLHGGGHSWKENGISREQVLNLNSRIGLGSRSLWESMRRKLDQAAEEDLL
ncbi:HD domain-containing protein [Thiolapillus brandeum]|uniref:HD superfamily hydrolase n=1 Tax=Thiolapillus brandeum TaxID=1076588 RepID=A0A7U6GI96_9GAMM|nr:HD domain-containing protein [Thiolapillus brandeum]BAO44097.1 HD superfamily hydrolase [Thiolapillus brandeum]